MSAARVQEPLRLAVDASAIRPRADGIGRYSLGMLRSLAALPADAVTLLVLHPRIAELPPDLRTHAPPTVSAPRCSGRPTELWRMRALGNAARRVDADVLWCPTGRGRADGGVPVVLSVHDALPLRRAGALALPIRERLVVGGAMRRSLASAVAIVAVSPDTAEDLVRRIPGVASRVCVIGQAADDHFRRPASAEGIAAARHVVGTTAPLWLHIGRIDRRKNVLRLLEAFNRARRTVGEPYPVLVLAGPPGNASRAVERAIVRMSIDAAVRRTGWLPDDVLRGLVDIAEFVVSVSLHEGFGRVALEASNAGRPHLSAPRGGAAGSLPGSLMVNPTSVSSIAKGMVRLATDRALRTRLGAAGAAATTHDDWALYAHRLFAVLQATAYDGDSVAPVAP